VVTVGVIGATSEAPRLRRYYADVLARLGLGGIAPLHDTGHLTRVRAPGSPLRRGGVIVAGDAGGLLDPWTREGISFALRSGRLAGAAAAAAAGGEPDALAAYPVRVEQVLGAEQEAGREVLGVYARHPAVMHALMAGVPGGFGLFERIISGRSTVARQLRRPGVRAAMAMLASRPSPLP
jgi:flavin-dependent dehydrogenase